MNNQYINAVNNIYRIIKKKVNQLSMAYRI